MRQDAPTHADATPRGAVNVLLGFSPFHALLLQQIAAGLAGTRTLVFHPDIPAGQFRSMFGKDVTPLGGDVPARLWRPLRYALAAAALRRVLAGNAEVNAYLPHPYHPLSNHLFFSERTARRYLYEDGLLNYYDALVGEAHPANLCKQRLRAATLGLRYRGYQGHICGFDAMRVDGCLLTRPDSAASPNRLGQLTRIHLPPCQCPPVSDPGTLLMLDQPIETRLSASVSHALRAKALAYCRQFPGRILYKPHPAQLPRPQVPAEWQIVDDEELGAPAELLVERHGVTRVVSYFSSSLINIALMHRHVHCVALAGDAASLRINGVLRPVGNLLASAGVECID